ncbi:hypothetical protein E5Q_05829 [Mixia osmundae IAM 14324]|uniref:Aquaporin n=1 Tax=Mixia osmundae (strain CBS 9802 / IAM 14324 / JCM 22182 / KY 12970) TaxID=764103 RepID=G7E8H9_MIXOS|nr:hypothetical protein E5Q_05829 [Mixia osmundae IAM 14324]
MDSRSIRRDLAATLGEFIGTFSFLLFAFGGLQAASHASTASAASPAALCYVALAFGGSLAVNLSIWYRICGLPANPAVSLALLLVGATSPVRFALFSIAEYAAGIAAAAVVDKLTPAPFEPIADDSILCLAVLFVAVEKHRLTPFAPLVIGSSLSICLLFASEYDSAGVNPARALGPSVVGRKFERRFFEIWILAPYVGAICAAVIYRIFKVLGMDELNPGQDDTGKAACGPVARDPLLHKALPPLDMDTKAWSSDALPMHDLTDSNRDASIVISLPDVADAASNRGMKRLRATYALRQSMARIPTTFLWSGAASVDQRNKRARTVEPHMDETIDASFFRSEDRMRPSQFRSRLASSAYSMT